MAPDPQSHDEIDKEIKSIINALYMLMTQASDHKGALSESGMQREVSVILITALMPAANGLSEKLLAAMVNLLRLSEQCTIEIPPEVIEYVQDGRNPDIYTREFVELAMKNNQKLKGKAEAFAHFRDILAIEIAGAVPELKDNVIQVVNHTGGSAKDLFDNLPAGG